YYSVQLELLVENSLTLPYQELTRLHLQKLEAQILRNPARWLWSHKRWKHQKPAHWAQTIQTLQRKFEQKFRQDV
ncbi:MAG: hypothetical protein ACKOGD_09420, partial [Sphingomonadales bacterium]